MSVENATISGMKTFMEYANLHLISLMQDAEQVEDEMEKLDINSKDWEHLDLEMVSINGQIIATRHLMSVARDMII